MTAPSRVEPAGRAGSVVRQTGMVDTSVAWPQQKVSVPGLIAAALIAGVPLAWAGRALHPAVPAVPVLLAVWCKLIDERACWSRPGWWLYDLLNRHGRLRWVGETGSPRGRIQGHRDVRRAQDGWILRPYRPARSRQHAWRIERRRILAARLMFCRLGNFQETERDRRVRPLRVVTVALVWLPGFLLEGLVWPERRLIPADRRTARRANRGR